MSYILQALKKSEQERELAAQSLDIDAVERVTASEQTATIEKLIAVSRKQPEVLDQLLNPLWQKGLLTTVLLMLLLAVGYLYQRPDNKQAELVISESVPIDRLASSALREPEVNLKKMVLKEVVLKEAVLQKPVLQSEVLQEEVLHDVTANETVEIKRESRIIRPKKAVEQASAEIKALIPNIVISSHIYSTLPMRRSIVVNGERMVEGDFIAAQVQIKEITHQGMIIDVNGWPLVVSRSRGWSR